MAAVAEYCPTCGSPTGDEGECPLCQVDRPPPELANARGSLRSCRRCGAVVPRGAAQCPACGTEHPTSLTGIPPVGLFVLSLFALAIVLGIISFLAGPLVR